MQDDQFKVVCGPVIAGMIVFATLLFPSVGSATDLTVVTTPFPPYVVYHEDIDQATGPAVDVIRNVCMAADVNCKLRVEPWARAYEAALQTPNTLIFSIARRPERETQFKWIGTVAPYRVQLFSLIDHDVPFSDDWRSLTAFHVAGQMRDVKAQFLVEAGFDVIMAPSAEATIRMLYADRAMLVAGDSLSLPYRVERLGVDITQLTVVAEVPELSTDLYLAASRNTDDDVIALLRNALGGLKSSGNYDRIWMHSGLVVTN